MDDGAKWLESSWDSANICFCKLCCYGLPTVIDIIVGV